LYSLYDFEMQSGLKQQGNLGEEVTLRRMTSLSLSKAKIN
jgi:hypothetical protein